MCIFNIWSGKDGKGWKWIFLVICYRGIVYLSYIEDNWDDEMLFFVWRVCYWGKRFEVEVIVFVEEDLFLGYLCGNKEEWYGFMKVYLGFFLVVRF